ncbi:MAG: hypothetical protein JRJ84_23960 [Deltaproteobacteria bacterium]|nr:hypothetical protein [Deltaproteobacteria bacterium]
MDPWQPPSEDSKLGTALTFWLALCLALGLLGTATTCWSTFGFLWGQIAAPTALVGSEQAEILAEIKAEQAWWVVPNMVLQLGLKLILSLGLIVGAGLGLSKRRAGFRVLKPVLLFGVFFEIASALWSLLYTVFNWQKTGEDFGRALTADPSMPAEFAEYAGPVFGGLMVIMMAVAMGWALLKAGLYLTTRRAITRFESARDIDEAAAIG